MKAPLCSICKGAHYKTFCLRAPKKPIKVNKRPRRVSDKQAEYNEWRESVARPYLIDKYGDACSCCGQVHYPHDIDEIKGRGSHPGLKRDLNNMQLLGRFPCHHLKTINQQCIHI